MANKSNHRRRLRIRRRTNYNHPVPIAVLEHVSTAILYSHQVRQSLHVSTRPVHGIPGRRSNQRLGHNSRGRKFQPRDPIRLTHWCNVQRVLELRIRHPSCLDVENKRRRRNNLAHLQPRRPEEQPVSRRRHGCVQSERHGHPHVPRVVHGEKGRRLTLDYASVLVCHPLYTLDRTNHLAWGIGRSWRRRRGRGRRRW